MSKNHHPSVIEQAYSSLGPVYNFIYGKVLFNEGRRVAIDLLELTEGNSVLEVGVGTGLTLPLYPHGVNIVGIDLSESMLNEARQLIEREHIELAEVKYMNANHLDFPDNHFDGVLGNLFISATGQPVQALLEMKRVCKNGGHLVLMNHFRNENKVIGGIEKMIQPVCKKLGFDSALEMKPLLDQAGLKMKTKKKVNFMNLWSAIQCVVEK